MRAIVILLCLFVFFAASGQEKKQPAIEKRVYHTQRTNDAIKLDGIPDEPAWEKVEWTGDFIQYQPNEKAAPHQPSYFKILFDNKYLYIAYRADDHAPDSIVKRMGRRDDFPGDWMEINIDSYHDLRSAFSFTLSASGVRGEEFISNNGSYWDASWNPIWYAKTNVGDSGWTAEVKIPFSQLRYGNEPDKVWGIQVQRMIFRKDERSTWQYIPQNAGGWVSNFGELRGLKGVPAQKQIEIAPYILGQTARYKKEEGNPFATGSDSKLSGGVDGKVAVTSDLILDFTVNPDFGQVEADPSRVRIDGFQNFFEERRPFFIESRNIFDFEVTGSAAGGDYDGDLLFYSRRIGGRPHGYPQLGPNAYAQVPDFTSILGAAKFSGKTKNGWSIGILESITERERAIVDEEGARRKELVEPLTGYFVSRLQKDIDEGNTVVGGIFTAVNREKGMSHLLHESAYSGGLDFLQYWNDRTWYLKANVMLSHVTGTPEVIANTQTSIEHLFQRPNNTEATYDPTRTSLTGTGGTFKLGKQGGKRGKLGQVYKFQTGFTWRSPELELNDIGFMLNADEINHFSWASVNFQTPISIFRNASINYNHWVRWDFGGQFLYSAFNVNAHGMFKNYWNAGFGMDLNPYDVSNSALRGGSSLRKPPGGGLWFNVNTDNRKKLMAGVNASYGGGFAHTVTYKNLNLSLTTQPLDALRASLSAGISEFWRRQDQFVSEASFNGEQRIIVGQVSQQTLSMTLRINYNITPDLTLQYYGQPFITRPLYSNFSYVIDPLNPVYDERFRKFTDEQLSYTNGVFEVDESGDGAADYSFYQPDFNFVQFRSNLVVRWEYKPGSELYLVWSQANTPAGVFNDLQSPLTQSLFNNIFNDEAKNIWLIKMTYRFLK